MTAGYTICCVEFALRIKIKTRNGRWPSAQRSDFSLSKNTEQGFAAVIVFFPRECDDFFDTLVICILEASCRVPQSIHPPFL